MTITVNAFGKNIQFPSGTAPEEIEKHIKNNQSLLDPDYKEPGVIDGLKRFGKEFAQNSLGVDMGVDSTPAGVTGLLNSVDRGARQTGRMIGSTVDTVRGDLPGVEQYGEKSRQAFEREAPIEQKQLLQELQDIDRDQSVTGQIGDTLSAAGRNKMGTAQLVAEQLPNTAVSLGSGYAGAKTGAAIGSLAGPVGAGAGGILGFLGGMFLGNVLLETGSKAIEKSESGFTPDERDETLREGPIKAAVVTGVDTATLGIGGKVTKALSGMAARAGARAEAKVLMDAGVNMATPATINAALSANPALMRTAKIAGEKAALSSMSASRKAGIAGTGLALETVGEGVGEYLGELAATGEPDVVDATIESLAGMSQSMIETAYNYNKIGTQATEQDVAKAASDINAERTQQGINNIAAAGSVDEAIQAASDTVSQKPVTTSDIWDDVGARNDLLQRAEQINQPEVAQNETQTAETGVLNQQITPQSTEEAQNQSLAADSAISEQPIANQSNNALASDMVAQNLSDKENAIAPPSRSPEERLKDRDSTVRLERALRNAGHEYKITPMDVRDVVALGNRTEQEAKQAENIAREFGKRVVWITADGPQKINGVVNSGIKDTIFVDVRSPNSAHAVVGHELSHHMENDAPQAYADMVESLKPFISGHQEYRAKYNIPEGMDIENVTKEMVGDVMGDNFNKPEFWKQVAEYNPSSFKRIADSVITWLKKLATKAKLRGLGSEQWVSDIQKTQDIVAKAVAQYTTAKPGSTKIRPFIGGNKWGNSEWNGRLTFPSRETAVASPSESDHQDKLKPLPDRSGQDEIFREKITLPGKEDKSQVKKPVVKVKKKRNIESKFSSAPEKPETAVKESLTATKKNSKIAHTKSQWFGGKPPHQMTENEFLKLHKTGSIQPSAYSDYERDGGLSWLAADKKVMPLKELPEPYVLAIDGDKFFVLDETLPYAKPFANKHNTEQAAIEEALNIINARRGVGKFKTEKYPVVIEPIIGKSGKKYEARQTGEKKKYLKTDKDGEFVRDGNNEIIYLSEKEINELGYPEYQQGIYVFDGDKPIAYVGDEFGAVGVYVEGKYQKEGIGSELMTRYLLNTPSVQIGQMTPAGENVTRAAHRKLSKITSKSSPNNDDIRFSRSDTLSQAGVNTEVTDKPSDLPEETKLQAFRRRSQDAMLRFKVMQNWLNKQGVKLSEAANVYQRENISKGKAANKVEDFRRDQLEPLIKRIAETSKKADKSGKFDLGDVATYLEATHIPEANERMRAIHKDDKATANGITDDQARKVIAQFEAMPNFAEFKKLAEEVRNIGSETLDMRLEAGLISQDQYDAYKSTYKNWVPLRGNATKQGFGKGLSTNAKDKRRMGHGFREDEFVLENLVQDRERALMQIEKNKVGMSVAQFLMEAGNQNIGTVDTPQKMRVMKDFSYAVTFKGRAVGSFETETGARNAINRITEKRGDLVPEGESFTQTDFAVEKSYDPHIVMMARPQLAENEIQVYVNGHAVKLQLNDPGLARAATNAGIEQVGSIIHGARMFNRFLSKAYTAWSPDFMFMNMARDAYSGTLVLTGKKGAAFAAKTFTNYGTAIKELIKGRKDPKKSEWVKRYRAAGGNIGAAYLSDIERVGEDAVAALQEFAGARETFRMEYNAQISKGSSEKKARTMAALKAGVAKTKALPVVGHLFETIERVNMIIENALRLATFKTAIEQGESDQQAAMLSKDLMNFNRKGEVANMMGAAYLFYNPGMQGAHIVGEALFTSKHKKQVWALLGALTSMSFMLAELARGGGDDDDEREWENVPDYIKDRNLIFNVGDGQVTVPVAYGFGIFHAFGNYLSDLNHGADMNEVSIKLASGMFENFSVFGNPILDDDRGSEIRIDQILPTLPKLMMGPGINMDSLGRQIQPVKAQWNESIPDSQNMFRSVRGTAYEDVAHFMNDITGGNKYNPGAVDISPNTIKYWVTSLTGGAGRFVSDVTTGAAGAAEGVAPELENVPVLRKFFRQPGVTDSRASFYKAKREVDAASQRYKKAMKDGDAFNSQKMLDENQEIIWLLKFASDSAKMASAKRDWVLDIQQDESLTKADKKLKIKEIELQEQRVYDQFLSVFDDAKKR